jgi:signal peptidase II
MIAGSMFSGGGLANAYERIVFGGVFDYLNVKITIYQNPFSFNLADFYIFVGAIMIVFSPNHKEINENIDAAPKQ